MAAIKTALDTIFNHPNVAPFVSKQLIQRLVTSNPSLGHITRVAYAFTNNGPGVRGDMKAVIKAILLDSEARSDAALTNPAGGRLREPVLRLTAWARVDVAPAPVHLQHVVSGAANQDVVPVRSLQIDAPGQGGCIDDGAHVRVGHVQADLFGIEHGSDHGSVRRTAMELERPADRLRRHARPGEPQGDEVIAGTCVDEQHPPACIDAVVPISSDHPLDALLLVASEYVSTRLRAPRASIVRL